MHMPKTLTPSEVPNSFVIVLTVSYTVTLAVVFRISVVFITFLVCAFLNAASAIFDGMIFLEIEVHEELPYYRRIVYFPMFPGIRINLECDKYYLSSFFHV